MTAPRAPKLRLFVALDLPQAARAALARFRDAAADPEVWRPLGEESFHVTLAFLGHRPEEQVEQVSAVLGALRGGVAAQAASEQGDASGAANERGGALRVLGQRSFPRTALAGGLLLPPRRARVLAVALDDPDGALAALAADVGAGLAAAGLYEPEARPFRPHVTVARLRAGARAPRSLEAAPEPLAFTAGAVTLYRSRAGRGGAVYEPLFAVGA